jgi:hypothetical protein
MTELAYASGHVDAATRTAILRRAKETVPPGGWWAEGINFVPAEGSTQLDGSSKMMLLGYRGSGGYRQVEPQHDMAMALRDARFLIRQLAIWSIQYRMHWHVTLDGAPCGSVLWGMPSPLLLWRWLQASVLVRVFAGRLGLAGLRRDALHKHADRWE